jgi:CRISPR-associated protein Csb1
MVLELGYYGKGGTMRLDYKVLADALHDGRTSDLGAIRIRARYEPAAGKGAKVYPPTFGSQNRGAPYLIEMRYVDGADTAVETVLLDSIGSQANRIEAALLDALKRKEPLGTNGTSFALPLLIVEANIHGRAIQLTSLEMPHRSADAYLRDSERNGKKFDDTDLGKKLRAAKLDDVTVLYQHCPTALVFGTWDSHRGRPELSFKSARVWTSEMFGVEPKLGFKVGSRMDPLGMLGGEVQRGDKAKADEDPYEWRLIKIEGDQTKEDVSGAPAGALSKKDKLSNVGHGNYPPEVSDGGVAVRDIHRVAALSLAGLRRFHFPVEGKVDQDRDAAGRTVLATLALLGDRLAFSSADLFLRSGCDLVQMQERIVAVKRGGNEDELTFDINDAKALFVEAVKAAEVKGLNWHAWKEGTKEYEGTFTARDNLRQALEANLIA